MPKIIIYGTPACPYCRMAKEYLKEKGFEYEDRDVAADEKMAEEAFQKSKQMSLPVIDIDGKIVVGFERVGIDKALGIPHEA